jgi:hypothetical protein
MRLTPPWGVEWRRGEEQNTVAMRTTWEVLMTRRASGNEQLGDVEEAACAGCGRASGQVGDENEDGPNRETDVMYRRYSRMR